MNSNLASYLSKNPKYRLVFDLSSSLDVESVDTGAYLADALHAKVQKSNLNMYASDAIRKMIRQHTHEHPEYGRYVALSNIGILFEPALAFNLETIIEQTSKDELLIIQAKGCVANECFFFLSQQDNFSFSLKNLTYTIVE
jgi:hypothetical protein